MPSAPVKSKYTKTCEQKTCAFASIWVGVDFLHIRTGSKVRPNNKVKCTVTVHLVTTHNNSPIRYVQIITHVPG